MDRRTFLTFASFGFAAGLIATREAGTAGAGPARTATSAAQADSTRASVRRELVIAQAGEPLSFDPHASTLSNDWRVAFNLFDTLIRRHPDGTLHPALATAWERTAPTTWTLALRSDVRWHDGSRFTSVDAKYSLDRTY